MTDERKVLAAWRWLHGISQRQLAKRARCSNYIISRLEACEVYCGEAIAIRIEDATGGIIRAEHLMEGP